jgi:hypothetical protein
VLRRAARYLLARRREKAQFKQAYLLRGQHGETRFDAMVVGEDKPFRGNKRGGAIGLSKRR